MAALISKKVDATVQSYPEIYQAKAGMNVWRISATSVTSPTRRTSLPAPISNKIACTERIHQGQIEGMHYVKTNKEGSLKILRSIQIYRQRSRRGTYEFFAQSACRARRARNWKDQNILASIGAGQRNPAEFVDMN